MSTTKLELDDSSGNALLTRKKPISNSENEQEDEQLQTVQVFWKQIRFVFRSIVPDLRALKCWQIYVLILYAAFSVVFSILDFNSLLYPGSKRSLLKWINDTNNAVPLWRRILLCLSGLSAFTNVVNVVLVIHGKISSYFWGILGAILYGSYAFAYGYVGDAQLFIFFYLPMQFVGIFVWSKALDNKSTTRVKSLKLISWFLLIFFSVILAGLFFYEIPLFSKYLTSKYLFETRFVPHLLDAMTNALSVIGQCLLILCYWEQYIIWTCVNLMLIVMYSGLFETTLDINLLLVWIMLTVNSSVGLRTWYSRWKNAQPPPSSLSLHNGKS